MSYLKPEHSITKEERFVNEALEPAFMTGEQIRAWVRPPLAHVQPFPPRHGYKRKNLTLEDVIDFDRVNIDNRFDYSGGPYSYSGTSRPAAGNMGMM